jgi:hypothetical protein
MRVNKKLYAVQSSPANQPESRRRIGLFPIRILAELIIRQINSFGNTVGPSPLNAGSTHAHSEVTLVTIRHLTICLAVTILFVSGVSSRVGAQTRKPLTNQDIVNMTKQGFDPPLIAKAIQTSATDFDVSAQALLELKDAGVEVSVMEAMWSAQATKPSAAPDALQGAASDDADSSPLACSPSRGCLIREGTDVPLVFVSALSSKTAADGDPVEFSLDNDLQVGETTVVRKGAHAMATVSNAKKAGMMGKGGELNIQLQYLIAGGNHIQLRGTKGQEGQGKVGATVALTVIFGPIGLIKHGKNVEIPAGTPLVAFVQQDIWLPPAK